MLSKLKSGRRNWIDELSRSAYKPSMEYCEDQNGTTIYIQATVMVVQSIQPCFLLEEILLTWRDRIFNTGSSSNFKSIQEYGQWTGGLSVRSTRQGCFFSPLNPQDASSRQRRIDWTGPDHGPRMELYKQSNHPDQDCNDCFNLRRAQDANFVFHQSSSGPMIFNDSMSASALDKVVTFCR